MYNRRLGRDQLDRSASITVTLGSLVPDGSALATLINSKFPPTLAEAHDMQAAAQQKLSADFQNDLAAISVRARVAMGGRVAGGAVGASHG